MDSVGPDVKTFKKGDRVLIACITSCATCTFCRKSMLEMCKNGGRKLGHVIDGNIHHKRFPSCMLEQVAFHSSGLQN